GQRATVDGRWFLSVGLGGTFQYQNPEELTSGRGGTQNRNFFIGPAIADLEYAAVESPRHSWRLGLGMFGHKYNPDAANLGEYLFRSGPYPAYLMTGGLLFINDNAAYLQGLHARYRLGGLNLNAVLHTETSIPPLYDWSLGLLTDY